MDSITDLCLLVEICHNHIDSRHKDVKSHSVESSNNLSNHIRHLHFFKG